ncbi:hypothetical protein [Clostridium sp. YIM B02569]|uniref:hypothetical protein n=1 Tax=Clostridium sp. YIM B02569 TaxID=2911967 RepID=UPI001EEAE33F|nr:hypothetical protein [Clostridium sp. YIM B02569]
MRFLDNFVSNVAMKNFRNDYYRIEYDKNRKMIKKYYIEKFKNNKGDIKAEKERVCQFKESLKAPFISIIIAIAAIFLSAITTIFVNIKVPNEIIFSYFIIATLGFIWLTAFADKRFDFYCIAEQVLEELLEDDITLNELEKCNLNNMKKDKKLILSIFVLTIIIFLPIAVIKLNWLKNLILLLFNTKENAIYYLQYFGALVGGMATFGAVIITTRQAKEHQEQNLAETRRIQEDNRKNQQDLLELKEQTEVKTNAFILENDLKVCFRDIFRMLVRYSIANSYITIKVEERSKWILAWKEILREFEYSSKWREGIKILSNSMNKDSLRKIYEIYILLDETKHRLGYVVKDNIKYNELYRNIALIPREEIFNEEFNEKFIKLQYDIESYNDCNEKIEKDPRKQELEKYEKKKSELACKIYDGVSFFEGLGNNEQDLGKTEFYVYMKEEWKEIFNELGKILM